MSRLARPAAELSRYAKARLALALKLPFGTSVTGYLVGVHIIARVGFGVVYEHVKADAFGRFANGHRMITYDVLKVERRSGFWLLHTWSGSLYVVVTFHPVGGRRSLDAFLSIHPAELHLTPWRLH